MSRLSRAQRVRLGAFVITGLTLFVGTVVVIVGVAALQQRDLYEVRVPGSVGGLNAGAQVRYNGIRVGRVEGMAIDREDIGFVRVHVALDAGTPIMTDTVAVLEMQGITGLRYIELTGGTREASLLRPGSRIPAVGSTIELLSQRATSIASKLEDILENLRGLTSGMTAARFEESMGQVDATIASVRGLIEKNAHALGGLIERGNVLLDDLSGLAGAASDGIRETTITFRQIRDWVRPEQVTRMLGSVERVARAAERRLSDDELGAVIGAMGAFSERAAAVAGRAELTLVQLSDDLMRALEEIVVGAEAFAEFAGLLREDPSALIRGRGDAPRKLP